MVATSPLVRTTSWRDRRPGLRSRILVDPRGGRWRVEVRATRRERVRGLRGRASLHPRHALLLERANSIHTFGLRFAITVVLLDRDLHVVAVKHTPPRRVLLPRIGVRHVLECPDDCDLVPGDVLLVE